MGSVIPYIYSKYSAFLVAVQMSRLDQSWEKGEGYCSKSQQQPTTWYFGGFSVIIEPLNFKWSMTVLSRSLQKFNSHILPPFFTHAANLSICISDEKDLAFNQTVFKKLNFWVFDAFFSSSCAFFRAASSFGSLKFRNCKSALPQGHASWIVRLLAKYCLDTLDLERMSGS